MREVQSAGIIVYHKNATYPSTSSQSSPKASTSMAGRTAKEKNALITYLLLQYAHGHWDFVKGKIEPSFAEASAGRTQENKQEAALRELHEETGITSITIDPNFLESFSYIYTEVDGVVTKKTVCFFIGCTCETEVILSDEHLNYAWLPFEQAMEKLTFENAREVLQAAHTFIMGKHH